MLNLMHSMTPHVFLASGLIRVIGSENRLAGRTTIKIDYT